MAAASNQSLPQSGLGQNLKYKNARDEINTSHKKAINRLSSARRQARMRQHPISRINKLAAPRHRRLRSYIYVRKFHLLAGAYNQKRKLHALVI